MCQDLNKPDMLAVSYMNLGGISREERHLSEAEDYYQKALDLIQKLCRKTGNRQSKWNRRRLSDSYESLGDLSMDEGNLDQAEDYYQQAQELRRQLYEEFGVD